MKQRLLFVALGLFFLFSLLLAQYFKIQIVEGEKWTKQALGQHEFVLKEPGKRGTFYSNAAIKKGHPETPQPLVFDVTKFHLFVDPLSIPVSYREEIANELIARVGLSEEVRGELEKKTRSRRLAIWLNRDDKEEISEWWLSYAKKNKIARNALFFVTDYQRSYPFGKLLGQILHTIRDFKDETTQEGYPTGGLEAYYNDVLKGKMGKRKLLRSPHHHLEIDKVIEEPEDGADIYLTVNHCIQAIVEEELQKGVIACGGKGGWAAMMDPFTGEILALAQYPFFEPANYRDFFNDQLRVEDAKTKAVTDAFELGSIMKPISLAIALKAGVFTPEEKIETTRSIFPGRGSHPLKDPRLHRFLNMYMAIQKSSNVFMAQIIDRVIKTKGNEWYRNELTETFGLGQKTGIELPGETTGKVPQPGKLHPNGTLEWSVPTPYSLSIGYNIMATSLQLLRAYAIFANGGYLIQPTLVSKIVKPLPKGGEMVLFDSRLELGALKVLEDSIVREVVKAMKYTTKVGGFGTLAAVNGYTEAGKTGTAEKVQGNSYCKKSHISSFIGFAPANLDPKHPPRFVLIVTIDEPEYKFLEGGIKNHMASRCAAPVFGEIAARTLEYLGEPHDDPFGYPPGDPRSNPEKADWMQERRDLEQLYKQWNHT